MLAAVRREIHAIDPAVPVANVRSFDNLIGESVAPRRLSVVLLGVFAGVAVLLASVGIYGVMSFSSFNAHTKSVFAWRLVPSAAMC